MEKVQKHNIAITKGTRNVAAFKKNQKEVEKSAAELVKLAKESKPLKEAYLKNAKDEPIPRRSGMRSWMHFAKTSEGSGNGRGQGRSLPRKRPRTCSRQ